MSDEFNSLQTQYFDTSDNIREQMDWVATGIQAQIIADFNRSKSEVSGHRTGAGQFQSSASRYRSYFVPNR
jgi:hypothetical protein